VLLVSLGFVVGGMVSASCSFVYLCAVGSLFVRSFVRLSVCGVGVVVGVIVSSLLTLC